jgi:hypothetical protein
LTEEERQALSALRFEWATAPDDVWRTSPFHVEALHSRITPVVEQGIAAAKESRDASPIGIALQGQKGVGKTHLLGWIRQKIQDQEGYFFLISLLDGSAFWESTVLSVLDGLYRSVDGRENQLLAFLNRISSLAKVPPSLQLEIKGERPLSKDGLDQFIRALRHLDNQIGLECQDTARAIVLYGSSDFEAQDIAQSYFLSMEEAQLGDRPKWAMRREVKKPDLIVKELFRLLALTGPSVVAIDQIDTLVAQSMTLIQGDQPIQETDREFLLLETIAGGLMTLREVTRRTLSIVSCLPNTWILIKTKATDTVSDRFREAPILHTIPDAETGKAIIEKRFKTRFAEIGFSPPYPTWPIKRSAFDDAPDFTPRGLLRRVDEHINSCLLARRILELDKLGVPELGPPPPPPPPPPGDFAELDSRFEQSKRSANVTDALDPKSEDREMPPLLSAGLAAWVAERADDQHTFSQDPPPSARPALHARLRQSLNEDTEDEIHWAFRAIAKENANAALSRIRAACHTAGLDRRIPKRKLYLLRNRSWSGGPRTREVIAAFSDAGGVTLPINESDLKTFAALKALSAGHYPDFKAWLVSRRPASNTNLFRAVFPEAIPPAGEPPIHPNGQPPIPPNGGADENSAEVSTQRSAAVASGHAIPLGVAIDTQRLLSLDLESFRKHAAIFAGSGSGKTNLIKRLIEECALCGVSAIVLDPNNDMAQLGDKRPEPPENWALGDGAKAKEYLSNTDVIVWTPRREAGRPLIFQPLPDFASVITDADEFDLTIETAVAALAPRANVEGSSEKAQLGQAVLRQAVRSFARKGNSELLSFIRFLSALPKGVSQLDKADKIAAAMAQRLTAAMVNDPLFGGGSEPVDVGLLLSPPASKRARISVISFIGLPTDDQRQCFVNQLQMALFAWIKKNPAGDRPLGGLFVMDEAQTLAPSGAMTPCTMSSITLASQARKYGLGLIFATQAPKGLHNRISGNAATQFFGFLNSPTQIAAAREMAQAKGGDVDDISRLKAGQFYVASEGLAFEKIQTPACLSCHGGALTAEDVIERARKDS